MAAFRLEQLPGGDIGSEPPSATMKWRSTGNPGSWDGDYFSWIASYALRNIPKTFRHPLGILHLQDLQVNEVVHGLLYEISAPYGLFKKETGAYQITVDQTGGTVHVSAGTRIAGYGPAANEVDNGGLIGVEGDQVKGVDIPVETSKISVNFRHPEGALNRDYIIKIGRLVGRPNNDTFLGYDPGEVIYLGGNFTESNTEATATYQFAISYNLTNFVVGGITVTEKAGWDVLSPIYKETTYTDGEGNDHAVKNLAYIEIVRPAGRSWLNYAPAFGWGGAS